MGDNLKQSLLVRQVLVLTALASDYELGQRTARLKTIWEQCHAAGFTIPAAGTIIPLTFPDDTQLLRDSDSKDRFRQYAYAETLSGDSFTYVYEYDDVLAIVVVENAARSGHSAALSAVAIEPEILSDELFFAALSDENDAKVAQQLDDFVPGVACKFVPAPVSLSSWGRFFVNEKASSHIRAGIVAKNTEEAALARWLYRYNPKQPPPMLLHHIYRAKLSYNEENFHGIWNETRRARRTLDERLDKLLPHLNSAAGTTTLADEAELLEAQRDAARLALWQSELEALSVSLDIAKEHLAGRAEIPVPAGIPHSSDWFDAPVSTVDKLLKNLYDERRYNQVRSERFRSLTTLVQSVHAERQQKQSEEANQLREVGVSLIGGLTLSLALLQVLGNDAAARKEASHWPLAALFAVAGFALPFLSSRWKRHRWDTWNRLVASMALSSLVWLVLVCLSNHIPWWLLAPAVALPGSVFLVPLSLRRRRTLGGRAAVKTKGAIALPKVNSGDSNTYSNTDSSLAAREYKVNDNAVISSTVGSGGIKK